MNPAAEPHIPHLRPPNPPLPRLPSTACHRHPDEHRFTGFCPSCLHDRLSLLQPSSDAPSSSFLPELRRTKSFSTSKNEAFFSGTFEPQRKSCDVRVTDSLWNLFTLYDDTKTAEEKYAETDAENPSDRFEEEDDHISSLEEARKSNVVLAAEDRFPEIVEEDEEPPVLQPEDFRTMTKDRVNLGSSNNFNKPSSGRDFKEIASYFWSAASVLTKKLQKWRRKQKLKKYREAGGGSGSSTTLPVEKPISCQFRETQSAFADYGFGRKSCDTEPRFSLDAGQFSFDDPRHSFDEPRASWDGYLIGRPLPPLLMRPEKVSVVECSPPMNYVLRSDTQMPVEDPFMNSIHEEDNGVPGGSIQTRDYYMDSSSSRRRKILDRSSSIRKAAPAVVADTRNLKSIKNAKVSPETVDYHRGPKLIVGKSDLRELRYLRDSNSIREDCTDMFEIGLKDNASVFGNGDRKAGKKLGRWRLWSIWTFIHRRGGNKDENDDRYCSRPNGVERSFSESWQDRNGDLRLSLDGRVLRRNGSVISRNYDSVGGSSGLKNGNLRIEMNGYRRKKRDEFVLERNHSARYLPNNTIDNGMLKLYLTQMRGHRRGGGIGERSVNRTVGTQAIDKISF